MLLYIMPYTYTTEDKHNIALREHNDIEKYHKQALIGTMNLSIGIIVTGIMIIKYKFMS